MNTHFCNKTLANWPQSHDCLAKRLVGVQLHSQQTFNVGVLERWGLCSAMPVVESDNIVEMMLAQLNLDKYLRMGFTSIHTYT